MACSRQLTNKIFELISVDVGRRHFHGRRQIQDDFFVWRGDHTSITAAQMSTAKSISVAVKLSGEYCKTTSVPEATRSRVLAFTMSVASVASLMISSCDIPKTTRRCSVEVELYKWKMTRGAPATPRRFVDQFLSGLAEHLNGDVFRNEPLVYNLSNKIKTVCEAAGNPTSISLNPFRSANRRVAVFHRGTWAR